MIDKKRPHIIDLTSYHRNVHNREWPTDGGEDVELVQLGEYREYVVLNAVGGDGQLLLNKLSSVPGVQDQ